MDRNDLGRRIDSAHIVVPNTRWMHSCIALLDDAKGRIEWLKWRSYEARRATQELGFFDPGLFGYYSWMCVEEHQAQQAQRAAEDELNQQD